MKYYSLGLFGGFVLGLCLFFVSSSFAVMEESVCDMHYRFDGLEFSEFYPEKVSYMQGDAVRFSYSIDNQFGSPLVGGDVKALVLYRGPVDVDRQEDDDVVDDFFVLHDVSIRDGDVYSGKFVWSVPESALPGFYVVNLYFPVERKFNVAGLTFMTSVPAAVTSFEVGGVDSGAFILEKAGTYLNGERYGFRMPAPQVGVDAPVEVKTRLSNPSGMDVDVVYQLFTWDDVEEELSQYRKTEMVSGSGELVYDLPGLPVGVYVARITASSGDWKSILKVRFTVKGAKARYIWAG
ncbi:MAG: hypothetical protein JW724_01725, partial [Candidatus Altiarchaeota archaeon]|nr:hypothetical protein [Candidatus Altiarchaeota archaeon]